MIVLDTNVVSELMRPQPDPAVRNWVLARSPGEAVTTTITLAEIRCGLERLDPGARRARLSAIAD